MPTVDRKARRYKTLAIAAAFLALTAGPSAAWDRFEIIEWQPRDSTQMETLKKIGVTAVAAISDRATNGAPSRERTAAARAAGLRWYVENMATDFYAPYHKFTPGKEVNWRFVEAQSAWRANPDDPAKLARDPPLNDPVWRARIGARLFAAVSDQKRFRPLYYSLGDETGIADLSAYWDFDLSPVSVAGFRRWLRGQYGSLAALNAEWGTSYAAWDAVQPESTRAAMRRTDDNFAAWNDFKAWMDTAFADAVRFGTDAIHRADPVALSAIEGGQMPGWGGYDYTKLAGTVDAMELYDMGDNVSIVRSLAPRLIPLATTFEATPASIFQIWRAVLRGARGLIVWDEDNSLVRPDASPGPRASAYAPVFAALRGDIGRRMQTAEPVYDDVAVLYSPPSFRIQWMLDHRAAADAWMERSAEIENEDNAWRAALRDTVAALHRMGLRPRFVTPEQLASGRVMQKVLILPDTLAMTEEEVGAVADARRRGVRVLADTPPGRFDGHGRAVTNRAVAAEIVPPADLPAALKLKPRFPATGAIDTFMFRQNGRFLLALQQREPGTASVDATVGLDGHRARNIVSGRPVGADGVVAVDPIVPTFLEIEDR